MDSADAELALRAGASLLPFDRGLSFAREMLFSAGFLAMCVQTLSAGAGMPLRPGRALPFLTRRIKIRSATE